jgi:hypothetical protein
MKVAKALQKQLTIDMQPRYEYNPEWSRLSTVAISHPIDCNKIQNDSEIDSHFGE